LLDIDEFKFETTEIGTGKRNLENGRDSYGKENGNTT